MGAVRNDRGKHVVLAGIAAVLLLVASACTKGSQAPSAPTPRTTSARAPLFADPVSYTGGKDPEALAVADLNGDGTPDLVTANSYGDDVSVYVGKGDGTFGTPRDYRVGTAPASVAVADVDGDGSLDLMTTNGGLAHGEDEEIAGSDDLSVLLGLGDGTFAKHVDVAAGDVPMGVVVVDVDADGALDLVTVDRHEARLAVLRGTGTGSFRPYEEIGIPDLALSRRVTAADLNGDGLADLLVPDEIRGSVWVLLATRDHAFDEPREFPTDGIEPVAVEVGDLDEDGRMDLVTANGYPAYDVSVLLADENGFGTPTVFGTGFAPHSVAVVDLNGDGILDVATGNVGDSSVSVLLGAGDGAFDAAVDVPTGSEEGNNTIAVADLNGDGKPDLVTTNFKPSSLVTVLLQTSA